MCPFPEKCGMLRSTTLTGYGHQFFLKLLQVSHVSSIHSKFHNSASKTLHLRWVLVQMNKDLLAITDGQIPGMVCQFPCLHSTLSLRTNRLRDTSKQIGSRVNSG